MALRQGEGFLQARRHGLLFLAFYESFSPQGVDLHAASSCTAAPVWARGLMSNGAFVIFDADSCFQWRHMDDARRGPDRWGKRREPRWSWERGCFALQADADR